MIFVGRETEGRERGRDYTAYHVISKQYKHQGDNQHHSTSILLGREREIPQFVQPQQSLFLKGPHISLVPRTGYETNHKCVRTAFSSLSPVIK